MGGRDFLAIAFVITSAFFLYMDNAYAYIDPGTGSIIIQVLVGSALAILAFWKRIYGYLQGVFHKKPEDDAPQDLAGKEDDA